MAFLSNPTGHPGKYPVWMFMSKPGQHNYIINIIIIIIITKQQQQQQQNNKAQNDNSLFFIINGFI